MRENLTAVGLSLTEARDEGTIADIMNWLYAYFLASFESGIVNTVANLFYGPHGLFHLFRYDHPVHPLLVHITIGSVTVAFLLVYVGWIFKKPALYTSARHVIVISFVAYFFTAAFGLMDWQHVYQHAWGPNIEMKLIFAPLLFLWLLGIIISNRRAGPGSLLSKIFYLVAFLNVVVLGFFGGNIVYGRGV